MTTNFEMVKDFHDTFGITRPARPIIPPKEVVDLRVNLIDEEFREFREAIEEGDIIAAADAIADLLVVVYGSGDVFGLDCDRLMAEVYRSNMSKKMPDGTVLRRDDGKVLKGPNYFPPNILGILVSQPNNFPSKDYELPLEYDV